MKAYKEIKKLKRNRKESETNAALEVIKKTGNNMNTEQIKRRTLLSPE